MRHTPNPNARPPPPCGALILRLFDDLRARAHVRQVRCRGTRRVLQRIELQSQPAVQRHVVALEPSSTAELVQAYDAAMRSRRYEKLQMLTSGRDVGL